MRLRVAHFETSLTRRQTMQKGTVKWFNPTKGYGFIRPSSGEKDVFVHISAVERAGLSTLNEGQTVEYELVTNRGKTSAENLKVAGRGGESGRSAREFCRDPQPCAGGFVLRLTGGEPKGISYSPPSCAAGTINAPSA